MNIKGNTILITGGASGIGYQFSKAFYNKGNQIIVCGRNNDKLLALKESFPEIVTKQCDVANADERVALFEWVTANYPNINVIVNNAGIQNRFNVLTADAKNDWDTLNSEIKINLDATVQLSILFGQYFAKSNKTASIINVSSGLAFSPMAIAPIYSATKAAVSSFSTSLRHQLSETNTNVYEVIPPAVNTDLGGKGIHTFGANPIDFINEIFTGLEQDKVYIGYGSSKDRLTMTKNELDQVTENMYKELKDTI
ncbi:SDR family NAD(P)-dependent oxidoreductase [Staphylococcus sp. ACRSN]|uniref:SDR family oxidoreductase n=1 Tax=Staphylococcus sp. ACRSN TaxID=2918214 RepID=UPI001EF22BD5|nr:SDR family NAD(P)-dependent oxidoreductase [Staphylococcus sp. ACRSN]MCG7337764.1 SDR family NAD(P)-dependent oxidoreductase [Staphylococcus sp. ACRSN]